MNSKSELDNMPSYNDWLVTEWGGVRLNVERVSYDWTSFTTPTQRKGTLPCINDFVGVAYINGEGGFSLKITL